VGDQDELFPCQSAQEEYVRLQTIYNEWNGVRFQIFSGVHEFPKDDEGIAFVAQVLRDV